MRSGWAESGGNNQIPVTIKGDEGWLVAAQIPHPSRPSRGCDHMRSVSAESGGFDPILVPLEGYETWLVAAQIPHPRRLVRGRCDHVHAVGAECGGDDVTLVSSRAVKLGLSPRKSHIRVVLSQEAVTTCVPSARNAAETTRS